MIGRYAVLSGRIHQELDDIERVVERVERALAASRQGGAERDLFFDAAALNVRDFYAGVERLFTHIAGGVDESIPSGSDRHRELLRQMTVVVPGVRPQVLSTALAGELDEFLRFRQVVRNIYAYELDGVRIEQLAQRLRPTFTSVRAALLEFAAHLATLARDP